MKTRMIPLCLLGFVLLAGCIRTSETPSGQTPLATPELVTPAPDPMMTLAQFATETALAEIGSPIPTETPPPFVAESFVTATWAPGDLGYGQIFGFVTDALTGAPLQFVTVICEQFSYSLEKCNARVTTDENGYYVFENVKFSEGNEFFLFFAASGYQPQIAQLQRVTTTNWQVSVALFTAYPIASDTPTPATLESIVTPMAVCTPPLCAIGTSEAYTCPSGECPGGCGVTCATYTPTP